MEQTNHPETRRLYDDNAYLNRFTANVLACTPAKKQGRFEVVLDQTAFFPEGGGQPADRGTLGGANVLDVQTRQGVITHLTDAPLEAGSAVEGVLDMEHRLDSMQQHSGEHILSGILHRMFGCENVGFHIGQEETTLDTSLPIPPEGLAAAEAEANRIVWADLPVQAEYPAPEVLATLTYRSKKAIDGAVRIVTIPGADCCACCGTHVRTSAEVGLVKFLSVQKFRQGVRIELLCGGRAQRYLSRCWEQARAIGQALSVRPEASYPAVEKLLSELAARKADAAQWQALAFQGIARSVAGKGDILLLQPPMEGTALRRLAAAAAEQCGGLAAVFAGEDGRWSYALCRHGGDVSAETKAMNAALSGRGGGRGPLSQGSVQAAKAQIETYFSTFTKG